MANSFLHLSSLLVRQIARVSCVPMTGLLAAVDSFLGTGKVYRQQT